MPATVVDPEVVRAMRRFQAGLLAEDEALLRAMARRWVQVERALLDKIELLVVEATEQMAAGWTVTPVTAQQLRRYRSLLDQLYAEASRYQEYAAATITRRQGELAGLGIEHARAALLVGEAGAVGAFDVLPVEALQFMVGLVSDGSPLREYLARVYPQAAEGMLDALVHGLGLGWNPKRTARAMRDGLGVGLRTALNTARTETLRVYREASRAQYQASGRVDGYLRLAAKSQRTCVACLAQDGEWYPLSTSFEDHVRGRCTMIPAREGMQPGWLTGQKYFEGLDAETQQRMMGKGLYEMWRDGEIDFEDTAHRHIDATWGHSWQVASKRQAVENKEARGGLHGNQGN